MVNLKKKFNSLLLNFYIKNIDKLDIESLSYNIRLPLKIIELFPNYNWIWDGISDNENITIEFILNYKQKEFNWYRLSIHPNISVKDIFKYSDLPWYFDNISLHPNITNKIVLDNLYFPWVIHYLVNNKNISMNTIYKIIDYKGLSINLLEYENILIDLNVCINKSEQLSNDKKIRENLNIDKYVLIFDIDNENIINKLSSYHFFIDEELYIQKYYINKIKNWWYEIISNPSHPIGLKSLEKKSRYLLDNN